MPFPRITNSRHVLACLCLLTPLVLFLIPEREPAPSASADGRKKSNAENTTHPGSDSQKQSTAAARPDTQPAGNAERPVLRHQLIYVGTNRRLRPGKGTVPKFGAELGSLCYAKCEVEVGSQYQPGQITDITVGSMSTLEDISQVNRSPKSKTDKRQRVLVFVHGFFVAFEESIRRATQIVHELDYRGTVFVYNWPSVFQLTPKGYRADEAVVDRSVKSFERFLKNLKSHFGGDNVQVLAHSLGCRLLAKAVQRMASDGKTERMAERSRFANIIFAAPDIEVEHFCKVHLRPLSNLTHRLTIYFSSKDAFLAFAERIRAGARLGRAGSTCRFGAAVEMVDYSLLPGGFFNLGTHNLYREYPAMVKDIRGVLADVIPVSHRQLLEPDQRVTGK